MFFQNSNTGTRVLDNASKVTDVVWDSINNLFTTIVAQLPYLIAGAIVIILFWMLSSIFRKVFISATKHTRLDERLRILFSRMIVIVVFVLGFFTALTVVVPSFAFGDFIAGLGLTSVAIGFATKDILNHLISGVLILWQQPFRTGDYLIMKDDEGKVEYIGVRATSLRRSTGEVVLVPNGDIYSSTLRIRKAGATYPMALKFFVSFDTDLERAKSITAAALASSSKVSDNPAPTVTVTSMTADGVELRANFSTNSYENRPGEAFDESVVRLVSALRREKIEVFPPSTMVIEQQSSERLGPGEFLGEDVERGDSSKAH
jgi:small-conductance mechanosensitive channel